VHLFLDFKFLIIEVQIIFQLDLLTRLKNNILLKERRILGSEFYSIILISKVILATLLSIAVTPQYFSWDN
jgi:hypothetical protein